MILAEEGKLDFNFRRYNWDSLEDLYSRALEMMDAPGVASGQVELTAERARAAKLESDIRGYFLITGVNSVEAALEALKESVGKEGAPSPESPYYKAAKEYFSDIPNGHLAFAELVRQVAEDEARARAQHPAFETVSGADWDEPCL